jgi:hypothetical protein
MIKGFLMDIDVILADSIHFICSAEELMTEDQEIKVPPEDLITFKI